MLWNDNVFLMLETCEILRDQFSKSDYKEERLEQKLKLIVHRG